jgi:regulator of sigma E protease
MAYWALAIVALGFLIVVHEGGHYFVARWCGMRIERFSIGFGPGILKRKSKKTGTTFQIAPIPFGGFVEIQGMNIAEEVDPEDKFAYPNRPTWQRFITIFAGPATNYLSAIVLCFGLYTCRGMDADTYHVAEAKAGYDAVGKLFPGDHIVAVDHQPVSGATKELSEVVNAKGGKAVVLTVRRVTDKVDANGDAIEQDVDVHIQPLPLKDDDGKIVKDKNDKPTYLLGVSQDQDVVRVSVLTAAGAALRYPVVTTKVIIGGLADIIAGNESADPGGPKRIVSEFRKAFESGFVRGFKLLMSLSVYLGLFNLFPLPALDGGRLVFLGYELVTRRRPNPKIEATVHMAGIMVLLVVMVLVTLHDFSLI